MVAHLFPKQKVAGSSPVSRSMYFLTGFFYSTVCWLLQCAVLFFKPLSSMIVLTMVDELTVFIQGGRLEKAGNA